MLMEGKTQLWFKHVPSNKFLIIICQIKRDKTFHLRNSKNF